MLCNCLLCYDDGDNDKDGSMWTTTWLKGFRVESQLTETQSSNF